MAALLLESVCTTLEAKMNPLLRWLFRRQLTISFRKLKDVLEADNGTGR